MVASNETNHVSIRYQYEGDVITAGIALDELEDPYGPKPGEGPNTLGVAGPPVEGFLRFQARCLTDPPHPSDRQTRESARKSE
ncbi:hypothetical protein EV291_101353 [Rhizobium sp. BK068]|nr:MULTISPECIES: hypothetical protein [unclassified Rhizobium]MBB3393519.1 hypothetical protein [Rhizobium sp. BK060]TCM81875.1 hypothetical protein EV291_101353 [Rhizobium sp. BK068]